MSTSKTTEQSDESDTPFFPPNSPPAEYGNQFIRHEHGKAAGTIEFNTPSKSAPANAQLYFEVGVPTDIKGMSNGGDQLTLIYKENHGNPNHRLDGKHNVKVRIDYKDGNPAEYDDKVELGVEDDHDEDTNPEELDDVTYQNTSVVKKYKTGGDPIRAKGSYQDTPDGGVRFKLEIQDPDTSQWMKIFDHVDYGDDNHDIKNYRGKSAYRSAIRIDGNAPNYDSDPLDSLKNDPITTQKTPKQQKQLDKLGYGNITFEEISADDGKWTDGIDDPLSFGKRQSS